MYVSYFCSVIILALALYGVWCVLKDVWSWYLEPRIVQLPSATFLIILRNCEHVVEDMMRYLLYELELHESDNSVVVVDCGSTDLTPAILNRLTEDNHLLTVVTVPEYSRSVGEMMPLCRGEVIHILDLVNRLTNKDFMITVYALLHQGNREIYVKHTGMDS